MYGRDPITTLALCIVESISCHAFRCIPCNKFDGLHNPINNFVLDTRILSLCILPNEYSVDIVVSSFETRDGKARPDVGEEIECSAEGKIQGNMALSDYDK
jgi:hypothetical protein